MYIARILNLIVGLILGYYSIKLIPFGKLLLTIYMFLPMYFQQEASISADSLINSVAIFFIAYNLYFESNERTLTDEEVTEAFNKIIENVCKKHNAILRNK